MPRKPKSPESSPQSAPRDPDRARVLILAAARAEFAAFGLSGSRVDRIAVRAGHNKRLLYYYFADKDEMFRAVLEDAYRHIRERERSLQLESLSPVDAISHLVHFTWDYYLEQPEFLSILRSANVHKARHLSGLPEIQEVNHPLVNMLSTVIARGQASGEFRDGLDAVQLYISIAGLAWFYLSNNHTLSAVFGRDLMAADALNERRTHITDVILGYVLKGSP